MSLQKRFFLVFSLSMVIAITLSVISIRSVDTVHRSYARVTEETFPLVIALEDFRYSALRIVSSTSEYGLVTVIGIELDEDETSVEQDREEDEIGEGAELLEKALSELAQFVNPSGVINREKFSKFKELGTELIATSEALRAAIDARKDKAEIGEIKERLEDLERGVLNLTTARIFAERQRVEREYADIAAAIDRSVQIIVAQAAIFALLLFAFWLLIVRTVVRPVAELNQATSDLSAGDFSHIPHSNARDEVGTLTTAFGKMAKSLQKLIGEKEEALKIARENELRFRDIADAASDWIWETDANHRIVFLSDRFSTVTEIAVEDVLGKPLETVLEPEIHQGQADRYLDFDSHYPLRDVRCRVTRADEEIAICRASGKPLFDAHGNFTGYRGTVTDITKQVQAEREAHRLALHDALTGLPNRVLLAEHMRQSIADAEREEKQVAAICIDLDRFKDVNDTLGHSAGDALLKVVAERLTSLARANDTVARLGGDEFVIIQTAAQQPAGAHRLCQRIQDGLGKPIDIGEHSVFPAASIGVSLSPHDGTEPEELLRSADIAMYRSKKDGRGNFCFYKPGMNEELQQRKRTENELRAAIANDALELHFQPLISSDTNGVVGFEALVRWPHPERGLIRPDDFIPLAEETGLILALGDWVLHNACKTATAWKDQFVAVNLSPVQFRDQNLVDMVSSTLKATGLPPRRLELEITESVLLADADFAFMVLDGLRDLGVRIAMDDFGTGYSSLSYLQRFHFDKIKLDRSFIGEVGESGDADAIVKAVLTLGKSLGMTTTAEGVETEGHVEFLKKEGCDQFQGYYFSKPVRASGVQEILAHGSDHIAKPVGELAVTQADARNEDVQKAS